MGEKKFLHLPEVEKLVFLEKRKMSKSANVDMIHSSLVTSWTCKVSDV